MGKTGRKTKLGACFYIMHQHVAASNGHEECVWVLLKYGCNIHVRGNLLVHHSQIFFFPTREYICLLAISLLLN